ncbi:MAG TPA: hypothetical protein VGO40_08440 [Longimicrobium sp.]|jgi:hypothetical protein|nr:hypothetical protein [Longimicrobium sp.]
MRWRRVLALCAALLCPLAGARAQGGTGTVAGTALDDQTGRRLPTWSSPSAAPPAAR